MICAYRIEKRRYQRIHISLNVLYRILAPKFVYDILGNKEFEGESLDLSEGGMALKVGHYLPVGTEFQLQFVIMETNPNGDAHFYRPLKIKAQVRFILNLGGGQFRVGLAFQSLLPAQRRILKDLLASHLRENPAMSFAL